MAGIVLMPADLFAGPMKLTEYAEALFRRVLAEVEVGSRIAARVRCDGERLFVDDREYELAAYRRIGVIAIGKAALSMSEALLGVLEQAPAAAARVAGIVVSGNVPAAPREGFRYFIGGHPLPTRGSLEAADAIVAMLSGFGPEDLVIFLISGGASAMVERASEPELPFESTVALYRALLHSGLPIAEMNCVRKHLSAIKGGRLAVAANGATQISLLVSDVPGDDASVIGSGPSVADASTAEECARVLERMRAEPRITREVEGLLAALNPEETPKPGDAAFARSYSACVLSPADVVDRAAAIAGNHGFHVEVDSRCDDWEYTQAARYLLERVRKLHAQHGRVCVLSSGELSVSLPAQVGVGGRNQQFALACALQLGDSQEFITVFSAGTDGIDGNSPAAGAVVDEQTSQRAAALGMDAQDYYERFDSYQLFSRIGAAIVTGPTENNLRDLRILLTEA